MARSYQLPDVERAAFARTNEQTIRQRAAILQEWLPALRSVAEVCCGDCARQRDIYQQAFGLERFLGVDLSPEVVALNRARGIECLCGDALDRDIARQLLGMDVVFFGPPLSLQCDGHTLLAFSQVVPSYAEMGRLLYGELDYTGVLVCICSRTTHLGDARALYDAIRAARPDVGLRLIHHSHSTVTGAGEVTPPRIKYVELWFSRYLGDAWEVRGSA